MISGCMKLSQNGRGGGERSHCKALQAGRLMARKSSAKLLHFRWCLLASGAPRFRPLVEELQKV
jgi:hypothetical protein